MSTGNVPGQAQRVGIRCGMIFVVGISGSGKTFTLAQLARHCPWVTIVSASGLLTALGRPTRPLTQEQALMNQAVLQAELLCLSDKLSNVMLDGHATIEAIGGAIPVPDPWYDALPFRGFVHIEASPEDISRRRVARGLTWTPDEASSEQATERDVIRRQSDRLGIPLAEFQGGDWRGLRAFAERVFRPSIPIEANR